MVQEVWVGISGIWLQLIGSLPVWECLMSAPTWAGSCHGGQSQSLSSELDQAELAFSFRLFADARVRVWNVHPACQPCLRAVKRPKPCESGTFQQTLTGYFPEVLYRAIA